MTAASDPRERTECPTCSDSFDSEHGMKIHHSRVHGDPVCGVLVDCLILHFLIDPLGYFVV